MWRFSLGLLGHYRVAGSIRLSGTYWFLCLMGRSILDLSESEFPKGDPVRIISIKLIGHTNVQVPEGTKVEIGGLHLLGRSFQEVESADEAVPYRVKVSAFTLVGGVYVHSGFGSLLGSSDS